MPAIFSIGAFSPKKPVTKPKLDRIEKSESKLDVEKLIQDAIDNIEVEDIEFFNAEEWTKDNEIVLLQKLHHLLSVIRPMANASKLYLEIITDDVARTIFHIKKI